MKISTKIREKIIIPILFFLGIVLVAIIFRSFRDNEEIKLKNENNWSEGEIYEINLGRNTYSFHYRYKVKDIVFFKNATDYELKRSGSKFKQFNNDKQTLIGYKFKVYYDPKNPENNYMDFNEFLGIDSTLWKAARRVK
ncbi:hypothetical protein [Emticicia oligotrophica]|uniref:hypothetical protein n=1 Tax=Emticicia oligotrophica TaxID=312279 RepID=UPI0002D62CBB|nr:hypothetical protein [Emticicia oligotrophica]